MTTAAKPVVMYVDQWGQRYYAATVKELRKQIGHAPRVSRMYQDGKDGKTYKVGYVIGRHWLTAYAQYREEV